MELARQRALRVMIALYIEARRVAADPRYGDPSTRLEAAARRLARDNADAAIRRRLAWIAEVNERRAPIDARWRGSR